MNKKLIEVDQEDVKSRNKVINYLKKKKIDKDILKDIEYAYEALFDIKDQYFDLLDKIEKEEAEKSKQNTDNHEENKDQKEVKEPVKVTEALEIHDSLNPQLFENDILKEDVLNKLLSISDEFLKYIEIPLNVIDIEIVGSNASYNYNSDSDIDLHIIVNSELSYVEDEILQQLYNAKKNAFNRNYDVNINNIPVELYIEDVNACNATNGRYSLLQNNWVTYPEKINIESPDITQDVITASEECCDMLNNQNAEEVIQFINSLYMARKLSLELEGEFGKANLVFKELRNTGLIEDLKEHYFNLKSNELSL